MDKRTDALRRQGLRRGSIFGSDVTSSEHSLPGIVRAALPLPSPSLSPEDAMSLALEAARGIGRRCPAMASCAPVNRLRSPVCTPALGSPFIPACPEGGEGWGGVEDESNLPVIAPAYSAGGTGKDHQTLRLQAHVSHLLKQCLEERCSGESFQIFF